MADDRRIARLLLLVVATVLTAVTACSRFPRGVDIQSAEQVSVGERQIGLVVGPCHADLSADVTETPTEVVVE